MSVSLVTWTFQFFWISDGFWGPGDVNAINLFPDYIVPSFQPSNEPWKCCTCVWVCVQISLVYDRVWGRFVSGIWRVLVPKRAHCLFNSESYSRGASGQMLIPWPVFPGWLQALAIGSIHLRHQSIVVVPTFVDDKDFVAVQWWGRAMLVWQHWSDGCGGPPAPSSWGSRQRLRCGLPKQPGFIETVLLQGLCLKEICHIDAQCATISVEEAVPFVLHLWSCVNLKKTSVSRDINALMSVPCCRVCIGSVVFSSFEAHWPFHLFWKTSKINLAKL